MYTDYQHLLFSKTKKKKYHKQKKKSPKNEENCTETVSHSTSRIVVTQDELFHE